MKSLVTASFIIALLGSCVQADVNTTSVNTTNTSVNASQPTQDVLGFFDFSGITDSLKNKTVDLVNQTVTGINETLPVLNQTLSDLNQTIVDKIVDSPSPSPWLPSLWVSPWEFPSPSPSTVPSPVPSPSVSPSPSVVPSPPQVVSPPSVVPSPQFANSAAGMAASALFIPVAYTMLFM
jgi:hypothetical protein